jgi:2-phosphosulfolactate phosphatase
MTQLVNVHLIPSSCDERDFSDRTAVVIDVLRASTTIVTALAAGAVEVIPRATIEDARHAAQQTRGSVLLGGERDGLPIEGFDLGNSPGEYTADRVAGRRIVFTTTNGTAAMLKCRSAQQTFIGAFVNLSALADRVRGMDEIEILCAGTRGRVSREDVLLAGAIVDRLINRHGPTVRLNDEAALARDAWRGVASTDPHNSRLASALAESRGGRRVAQIGMQNDLALAAAVDGSRIVPELDSETLRIRIAQPA